MTGSWSKTSCSDRLLKYPYILDSHHPQLASPETVRCVADVLRESLFTVCQLDDFVPASHPLRPIHERLRGLRQGQSAQYHA